MEKFDPGDDEKRDTCTLKGFYSLHHILLLSAGKDCDEQEAQALQKTSTTCVSLVSDPHPVHEKSSWAAVVRRHTSDSEAMAHQSSSLISLVDHKVREFACNERLRIKSRCPVYERFLSLIMLSSVNWHEVGCTFVGGLLMRCARPIFLSCPSLAVVRKAERTTLSDRAVKSWVACSRAMKFAAFQIRFMLTVREWARRAAVNHVPVMTPKDSVPSHLQILSMYNRLDGLPGEEMVHSFQNEVKQIEALTSFGGFFQMINMPRSDLEIQNMLCDAMEKWTLSGHH